MYYYFLSPTWNTDTVLSFFAPFSPYHMQITYSGRNSLKVQCRIKPRVPCPSLRSFLKTSSVWLLFQFPWYTFYNGLNKYWDSKLYKLVSFASTNKLPRALSYNTSGLVKKNKFLMPSIILLVNHHLNTVNIKI